MEWAISRPSDQDELVRGQSAQRAVAWPTDLAPGVYRLRVVDARGTTDHGTLVAAPDKAFAGEFERVWVLTVQLYSLRSASNWGHRRFQRSDGGDPACGAGRRCGSRPPTRCSALFDNYPADCSPYSPNSRLFLNPLYVDVTKAPNLPAHFLSEHADSLEVLRRADLVDYTAVAGLKCERCAWRSRTVQA